MDKYRLACDFIGEGEGELNVKVGDLVLGLSKVPENGWLHVKTLREPISDGFVPFSYLNPVKTQRPTAISKESQKPALIPVSVPVTKKSNINGTHSFSRETKRGSSDSERITSSKPSNPFDELDFIQQSQPEKFEKTLGLWRERERRFLAGEKEKLPQPKTRIYFYWDKNGVRHGPLTEAQMKARFEMNEVSLDTKISLAVDDEQKEVGQETVQEYFPEIQKAFKSAPVIKDVSGGALLWCYRDDTGAIQGPYSAEQMYKWFQDGFFNAETMVRLSTQNDNQLVQLQKLFPDGSGAFLTKGNQAAVRTGNGSIASKKNLLEAQGFLSQSAPQASAIATSSIDDIFSNDPIFADTVDSFSGGLTVGVDNGFSSSVAGTNPFAPIEDSTGGWNVAATENVYVPPVTATWDEPLPPTEVLRPEAYKEFDPLADPGDTGKKLLVHALSRSEADQASKTDTTTYAIPPAIGLSQPTHEEDGPMIEGAVPLKHYESDVPPPAESKDEKETKDDEEQKRIVANSTEIESKHLSTVNQAYLFLTRALNKDLGTVQCRIRRSLTGLHVNYNIYELFLEKEGKRKYGPQLLRAVKHKRFGVSNYYEISIGEIGGTQKGKVIARLQLNTFGTSFVLHNDVPAHKGKGRDLCAIHYLSNISKNRGPRKMKVVIPNFKPESDSEFVTFPHQGSTKKSEMLQALHKFDFSKLQTLINKPPKWSKKHHAWTLNFHGRVTRSSVKNFQLVRPEDHDHVVLQHGKIGLDSFTMDMQWPITPLIAFAICISSLHSKLAVE